MPGNPPTVPDESRVMSVELHVRELAAEIVDVLLSHGDCTQQIDAIELSVTRYVQGLFRQGFDGAYVSSVLASVAVNMSLLVHTAGHVLAEHNVVANPSDGVNLMLHKPLEETS